MELLESLEFLDPVELTNSSKSFAVVPLVTILSVSVRTVCRSVQYLGQLLVGAGKGTGPCTIMWRGMVMRTIRKGEKRRSSRGE